MQQKVGIQNLFKEEQIGRFDFSKSPILIRGINNTDILNSGNKENLAEWEQKQNNFTGWAKDSSVFNDRYVSNGKLIYESFFNSRGMLSGNVLDIGGGWGLFRQWWDGEKPGLFVVHDPGVERFLRGPHKSHHKHYERAFSLPMTFVDGFGENLPYRDEVFDSCLVAAALDHCLDPQEVISEAYRCLRPGGLMIIFQHSESVDTTIGFLKRMEVLLKRLRNALFVFSRPGGVQFFIKYYLLNSPQQYHLHHFSKEDLIHILAHV